MKSLNLKILASSSAFLALAMLCASAQAITLDSWITIGNINNPNDSYRAYTGSGSNIPVNNPDNLAFGSVNYEYQISRTEVTNTQYVDFLNSVDQSGSNTLGLYNTGMTTPPENPPATQAQYANTGGINFTPGGAAGTHYSVKSGYGSKPVVATNYFDALRFTNWLYNGGGIGDDTENGAYTLDGGTPFPNNPNSIVRNSGANVFLPNEDEWYKAAYYDPNANSGAGGYVAYAAGSDTAPTSEAPPGTGSNSANFYDPSIGYALTGTTALNSNTNYLSDVGAYTNSLSPYGTLDQGGNVMEWFESTNDTFDPSVLSNGSGNPVLVRGLRGGGWEGFEVDEISSSYRTAYSVDDEDFDPYGIFGFRIASLASFELGGSDPGPGGGGGSGGVPEPSTLLLSAIGLLSLMQKRRRK
jgi:formylglycine-generating enzyme required for sulfatase activity